MARKKETLALTTFVGLKLEIFSSYCSPGICRDPMTLVFSILARSCLTSAGISYNLYDHPCHCFFSMVEEFYLRLGYQFQRSFFSQVTLDFTIT